MDKERRIEEFDFTFPDSPEQHAERFVRHIQETIEESSKPQYIKPRLLNLFSEAGYQRVRKAFLELAIKDPHFPGRFNVLGQGMFIYHKGGYVYIFDLPMDGFSPEESYL